MDKSRNNPIIRMSHTACSAGRRRLRILAFWQAVRAWWIQRGSSEREKASISEEKASTTKSMSSSDIKNPGTEGCSRIVSYWQDRSSTLKRSALAFWGGFFMAAIQRSGLFSDKKRYQIPLYQLYP